MQNTHIQCNFSNPVLAIDLHCIHMYSTFTCICKTDRAGGSGKGNTVSKRREMREKGREGRGTLSRRREMREKGREGGRESERIGGREINPPSEE